MLSPLDLQNKKIVTKKRKYDKIEMDEYLDLIFENYKELYTQNQELQKQVKTLSDGVQYYRSIESTMQKALVLAEKTSKETKDAAILKAEAIEKDAESRASKIVSEAEQEYEVIKDKCLYLVQQFNQYKMQLKQVAAAQLELISSESFDIYSPELDALQNEAVKETAMVNSVSEADGIISSVEQESDITFVQEENSSDTLQFSDSYDSNDVDKTMILPNIKTEKGRESRQMTEEDEMSILTADTIDLRDSIREIQTEEKENEMDEDTDAHFDDAQVSIEGNIREVMDAKVVTPHDADTVSPMDVKVKNVKSVKTEVLEPMEPLTGQDKEAPTLDSLLQNMNLGKKKKKKKGQEEDPFEFLGSVDDF